MPVFLYAQEITNPLRVFGYRIEADGRLAPLPGSPWSTGNLATCNELCQAIAASPRRLLFAGGDAGITVFRIGADGGLRRVPGDSPDPGPVYGLGVIEVDGRSCVYATDSLRGEIRGYQARVDGTLAALPVAP